MVNKILVELYPKYCMDHTSTKKKFTVILNSNLTGCYLFLSAKSAPPTPMGRSGVNICSTVTQWQIWFDLELAGFRAHVPSNSGLLFLVNKIHKCVVSK